MAVGNRLDAGHVAVRRRNHDRSGLRVIDGQATPDFVAGIDRNDLGAGARPHKQLPVGAQGNTVVVAIGDYDVARVYYRHAGKVKNGKQPAGSSHGCLPRAKRGWHGRSRQVHRGAVDHGNAGRRHGNGRARRVGGQVKSLHARLDPADGSAPAFVAAVHHVGSVVVAGEKGRNRPVETAYERNHRINRPDI